MAFNVTFSESTVNFDVGFSDMKIIESGGTSNHDELENRDLPNQHPIEAIEKLRPELDGKIARSDCLSNQDIENILKGVM